MRLNTVAFQRLVHNSPNLSTALSVACLWYQLFGLRVLDRFHTHYIASSDLQDCYLPCGITKAKQWLPDMRYLNTCIPLITFIEWFPCNPFAVPNLAQRVIKALKLTF